MSEIERAIEVVEGYIKAVEQRMQSGDCGVVVGYHAMLERQAGLKTALNLCRAELDREKTPLTCDGCRRDYVRRLHPLAVNDMCQRCIRLPQRSDRYEPKGEQPCLK